MSELIRKSHNVSVLLYHYVCLAKYRKVIINSKIDEIIKETCLEISKRYEIEFISAPGYGERVWGWYDILNGFLLERMNTYDENNSDAVFRILNPYQLIKENR
ncbi:MAG: transposase [Anaerolineaceae bacterium]|nr:transposase [Anaerolineaceae bacterium]